METLQAAPRRAARAPPGRQRSGSAPAARARSARTATTRKACASARRAAASRSAVKVWDERTFRNLDGDVELNTRNIKIALRRLRRFAREGVPEELDLDGTIEGTARNAGWLDLSCSRSGAIASRCCCSSTSAARWTRTSQLCEELFSAAKSGVPPSRALLLPQLRLRPRVARQRAPPQRAHVGTLELLRTYGPDWKVIVVGDAAMSPYELHAGRRQRRVHERRAGHRVARRASSTHFRRVVWWNPEPPRALGVHALDADRSCRRSGRACFR